jgi:putative acetyltransferase
MESIRIRPSSADDLERLLHIWEDASRVGHPFLSESFLAEERERVRHDHLPAAETWVLTADDEPIAFLSLVGNEVGGLFVDPARHRMGAGRALLDFAKDLHATLEVEVFGENARGRAFYRACGFGEIGEELHAETGRAIVRMRCEAG